YEFSGKSNISSILESVIDFLGSFPENDNINISSAVSYTATLDNKNNSFDFTANKVINTFRPNLYKQKRFFDYNDKLIKRNISYINNTNVSDIKDAQKISFKHIFTTLGFTEDEFVVKNSHQTSHNGISHIYMKQVVNGLEVSNGNLNINIDKFGNVMSLGSTFYKPPKIDTFNFHNINQLDKKKFINTWAVKNKPSSFVGLNTDNISQNSSKAHSEFEHVTVKKAVKIISKYLGQDVRFDIDGFANHESNDGYKDTFFNNKGASNLSIEDGVIRYNPKYMHLESGDIVPVWDLLLMQRLHVWNFFVSALNGDIVSITSWTSNASYRVYAFGTSDPSVTVRTLEVNPQNHIASPMGWHEPEDNPLAKTTYGNNALVQKYSADQELDNMYRPFSDNNEFDYRINLEGSPDTYINATLTNLFYIINMMHDLMYQYGFDEKSGNFQNDNYNKGGLDKDPVLAFADEPQNDGSAKFTTFSDGRMPILELSTFDGVPIRDISLDNDIIIHELTHGVSSRLVGGPSVDNCLDNPESMGMGEGWSDFVAIIVRVTQENTRNTEFILGQFSSGRNPRPYPYTTNPGANPATFDFLNDDEFKNEHGKGFVWATILYEMFWDLIKEHGFSEKLAEHDTTKGNVIALQIVIDAMKLHACNPDYIQARNDIITAYKNLPKGKNDCVIWKSFARRGLGTKAEILDTPNASGKTYIESTDVPARCDSSRFN
ncbi:hypothetical protein BB561_003622, partial [Smittium simulii]